MSMLHMKILPTDVRSVCTLSMDLKVNFLFMTTIIFFSGEHASIKVVLKRDFRISAKSPSGWRSLRALNQSGCFSMFSSR